MNEEMPCSSHPDTPHSFMRDASHIMFVSARVGILIVCVPKPLIGVYGASSLSTMIYAAKEAQWDGTLNICTPWIDNDS